MRAAVPGLALALLTASPALAVRCDAVWRDGPRGRDIAVRIDMPAGAAPVPAVIWSPGLGGGTGNAERWVAAWTAAGIAVLRLSHPGSDAAVYAGNPPPEERNRRVRAGASALQIQARIADVGFVADELARRRSEGACNLARIDLDRLGLAGHSMGAWVTQWMAGQRDGPYGPTRMIDRRFRAFVVMSGTGPPEPDRAVSLFGSIARPLLVVSGTLDGTSATAPADRRARALAQRASAFEGAPADGRKALLMLNGAGHMLFAGDRGTTGDGPAMQERVAAITTLWWRRWLRGDAAAEAALAAPALGPQDRWQQK